MRNRATKTNNILLMALLAGCSEPRLELTQNAVYGVGQTNADICTTPADQLRTDLKFIFVVDRSRSNVENFLINSNTGLPGSRISPTDPDGARRYQAISNFVGNYAGDPTNTYWSIVRFSDRAETITTPAFYPDATRRTDFLNLISDRAGRLWRYDPALGRGNPDDNGATNYSDALIRVREILVNDVNAEKEKRRLDPDYARRGVTVQYVIFFISDGAPWIVAPSGTAMERIQNVEIQGRVNEMMDLQNTERQIVEGIQLHTGYYKGDNSTASPSLLGDIQSMEQDAENLLYFMAVWGRGRALSFSAGQRIDFDAFGVPTRIPKFALKELWVQNTNVVWLGNRLVPDSDGDMIPDVEEIRLGSNPNNPDSDRNGVGDGVEYLVSGRTSACADSHKVNGRCTPGVPESSRYYCGLPATPVTPGGAIYPDTDNDYLNDCEESAVLRSLVDDADSNQDYIPDILALANELDFLTGTVTKDLDPDFDGLTNYFELRRGTPVRWNNANVPGLRQMRYTSASRGDQGTSSCFAYSVSDMATTSNSDAIRIFVMESTSIISEKRKMRTAVKRAVDGVVRFSTLDLR